MPKKPPQLATTRHVASLDGLRGVAILMVLMVHLADSALVPEQTRLLRFVQTIMWTGWSGVDLFFVLSGFLITGILLDSRSAANYFSSFYMRRVLRIFPLYYFAVIATIIAVPLLATRYPWLLPQYPTKLGWLSYFLYYQNWWIPLKEPGRQILGHFWSLGVEEEFYLLWPACVWLVAPKHLKWICLWASLFALGLRYTMAWAGAGSATILFNTLTRLDTLLIGGFVAISIRDRVLISAVKRISPILFIVCVIGIGWIDIFKHEAVSRAYYTQTMGFTLYACAYACIVLWAVLQNGTGGWFDRLLNFPILRMFGRYSYGIYVYHGVVFLCLSRSLKGYSWYGKDPVIWIFVCLLFIVSSLGVAILSFKVFESPFLAMKKWFRVEKQAALVPQ